MEFLEGELKRKVHYLIGSINKYMKEDKFERMIMDITDNYLSSWRYKVWKKMRSNVKPRRSFSM